MLDYNVKFSRSHKKEENKTCTNCGQTFPATAEYFCRKKESWDGLQCECKTCTNNRAKKYRENNKEKIRKYDRLYKATHKKEMAKCSKIYCETHKEENRIKRRKVQQTEQFKQHRSNYKHYKMQTDIRYSLNSRMRNRMNDCLKRGKQGKSWTKLVSYSVDELKEHLESLFLPGMSWKNRSKWHIDHIKPIASFHFNSYNDIEFKKCWALNNLRPLWANENWSKHDKWNRKQEDKNGNIQIVLTL